jgi:D-alanine-D-alanine ligase
MPRDDDDGAADDDRHALTTARRLRVALLAGGRSSEHDISIASARSVLEALDPDRYDVVGIAIGRDGHWALQSRDTDVLGSGPVTEVSQAQTLPVPAEAGTLAALGDVDVALPILHGPFGEDGTVQGLLELAGVPYVGAGVAASALAMDKDLFKKVMRDSGIPVARHHTIRLGDTVENPIGYPAFVKPARLGSSVGISKVHAESELPEAVALARRHDEKVLVEEAVTGMEVECGVLGNRQPPPIASLPGRIDTLEHEWYDYASKYDEGGMELVIPPELPQRTIELVQQRAVDAFVASECEGMARVDFFVRDDGEVVVNELNTIPGFTATSVYAKLFAASGIAYADLLDRLIELALERHELRSHLEF